MAQDYSEANALKQAKETVGRLEAANPGNSNKVAAGLMQMQQNNPISRFPTSDEIFKQRVAELASAYSKVSDGAGGTQGASKQAAEQFRNVLDGKMPNGVGYSLSQRLALLTEKTQHLVEGIHIPAKVRDVVVDFAEDGARKVANNAGKFGLGGKAVGALAGVTVTALSGNASAAQLTEAGLNGVSNGLGTLTIGEGSGRNRLCQIFGDVVVPGAVGIGTGLVATPVAGIAASAAASVTLSDPSTKACNSFAQKLGF